MYLDWKLADIVKFLKKYPIVYKIFKLPQLNIFTNEDVKTLINYCKEINNKFLRFTVINFDHTKLEQSFCDSYNQLLYDQGLEDKKEQIYQYMSNKGILEDLNRPIVSLWKQSYSNTPKSTC